METLDELDLLSGRDLPQINITNGTALQMFEVLKRNKLPHDTLRNWFAQTSGVEAVNINLKALESKLNRVRAAASKKRGQYLQEFKIIPFTVPTNTITGGNLRQHDNIQLQQSSRILSH